MASAPETIAELLRDFFPISAPGDPPLGSLINVSPNYHLIREFADFAAALSGDFSEKSIPRVIEAVQKTFNEEIQNRLTDNYPLIPYGQHRTRPRTHERERSDWDHFLSEIRLALMRAIRPEQTVFLNHVSDLSESDRAILLHAFMTVFLSSVAAQQVLKEMESIERGDRASCQIGGNDQGFDIASDHVDYENDGDGAFEENEIIRIHMTFAEFRAALRDWATTLVTI